MQRPFILNPGMPGLALCVGKGEAAGAGTEQHPGACSRHAVFCNSKYRSRTDHTQLWVVPRCPDPPNLALWFQPFHNPGMPGLSWNARGYIAVVAAAVIIGRKVPLVTNVQLATEVYDTGARLAVPKSCHVEPALCDACPPLHHFSVMVNIITHNHARIANALEEWHNNKTVNIYLITWHRHWVRT